MFVNRREFLSAGVASLVAASGVRANPVQSSRRKARIAITLDLEMSRHYPRRGMIEWDYQKGNLDGPTKEYAVEAARLVKKAGGVLHFFCVGRVLEQPDVDWLKEIAGEGHPVGNHTYDHVNVKATRPEETQFRFQRAPWLVRGKTAEQVIRENIELTTLALRQRAGITARGFRTPGGFGNGLEDRPDLRRILLDQGFRWVSSKYPGHKTSQPGAEPGESVFASIVDAQRDAQPFAYADGLIEIPMSPISDVGAFRSARWTLEQFLKATRQSVEWAIEHGAVFDFLGHPSCLVVEDPEFQTLRMICELAQAAGDRAALVSLDAIAVQTA